MKQGNELEGIRCTMAGEGEGPTDHQGGDTVFASDARSAQPDLFSMTEHCKTIDLFSKKIG